MDNCGSRRIWFLTPTPSAGAFCGRQRLVPTSAGNDSLVFPTEGGATPEFFGKLDGTGGLRLVAHPLPRADGHASAASVAAEHGGAHVWEFQVR